ncbi:hypothetical protein HNP38_001188 [Chryseobacterium defluvii]|uniref:C1q domain-containing protein n=1 Tax=Chryseobacterium defluvii TaxID=160396 RepID=A0A840K9L5_9FLAO|nr:hypothetical protein [Chryseobacterium defluvii]MBB4805916.1 hypothetical protein [Chryseobacterium defluvii]
MKALFLGFILCSVNFLAQVGINSSSPTHMLHVKGNGTLSPFRVEGLQSNQSNLNELVSTSTGVVKKQDLNSISAVRVTGTLNMPVNNIIYATNATSAPVEEYDNLNEFSGNVFTASQAGLYMAVLTITYPQRSSGSDAGDGYLAYAIINDSGAGGGEFMNKKIYNPESSLVAASQYITAKYLVKMNAGQILNFETLVYGSTNNVNGVTYKINIVRMD